MVNLKDIGMVYNVHPEEATVLEEEGIISYLRERRFDITKVGRAPRRNGYLDGIERRAKTLLNLYPAKSYVFDCHLSYTEFPQIIVTSKFAEQLTFTPSLWIFPRPRPFPYFSSGWNLPVPYNFITLEFVLLYFPSAVRKLGKKRYLQALIDELVSFIRILP